MRNGARYGGGQHITSRRKSVRDGVRYGGGQYRMDTVHRGSVRNGLRNEGVRTHGSGQRYGGVNTECSTVRKDSVLIEVRYRGMSVRNGVRYLEVSRERITVQGGSRFSTGSEQSRKL